MSSKYNEAGVQTTTPRARQVCFLDAMFDAQYDVNVLAAAFNMEKAEFIGSRFLIDDFTTFDNARWDVIRSESTGLETVTAAELAIMADVIGVFVDENWFQIYDNMSKFTEKYVAAGLRWNYFYHNWKTISTSPFSNAVVFVKSTASLGTPTAAVYTIESKDVDAAGNTVLNMVLSSITGGTALTYNNMQLVQNQTMTDAGVAVQPYGSIVVPSTATGATSVNIEATDGVNSYVYARTVTQLKGLNAGSTVTLAKV